MTWAGLWHEKRYLSWLRSHGWEMALLLLLVAGVQTWRTWGVPEGVAPDFTAPSHTSGAVEPAVLPRDAVLSLTQWRARHSGQPVALHFWAEWCPICQLEEPMVDALAADWPVLNVATQSGDLNAVLKTLQQRGRDWHVMNDPTGDIRRQYGLSVLPAWVIVDAQGHISASTTGYTTVWGLRVRLWWSSLAMGPSN